MRETKVIGKRSPSFPLGREREQLALQTISLSKEQLDRKHLGAKRDNKPEENPVRARGKFATDN